MTIIKTPEDWWTLAESIVPSMINALEEFGVDTSLHKGHRRIDDDPHNLPTSLADHLTNLVKTRDPKAVRYCHEIWASAPDQAWIHKLPNWHDICDLCSEDWVFHEEAA